MKDLHQVLEQKKTELERVRREIEALRFVIPLLAEGADWIDNELPLPASQLRETGLREAGQEGNTSRRVDHLDFALFKAHNFAHRFIP